MALLWSSLPSLSFGAAQLSQRYGLSRMKAVFLPVQRGLDRLVLLQAVEVFQEQEPGGLLGVVELGRAAGLFPEDVVDVLEGLFKHEYRSLI